ncbi:AMP-binding protein [Streptomyces sp. ISL-12]|uniref:AMP-binding protein n=1 Tax=Streptomyces sp. ISL-12 TaxID=2819177 RepID=UPI001BE641BE|nr:AMP-binding protein [Streptomyces sp. ISL-12]MBT2413706.1 AMP-binding protein [Streptomyces sp. ISL-12]
MTSVQARIQDLLSTFGAPDADVARLLCDRRPPDAVAFTVLGPDLESVPLTYGALAERSRLLAGRLRALGVGPGDRVATLMGKSADLPVSLLAIWRLGAVHVPLFTAFAPDAVRARTAAAKAVITDPSQSHKVDALRGPDGTLPWHVLEAGPDLARAPGPVADTYPVGGAAPFLELYTSGTTGPAKPVPVPVRAIAAFAAYQEFGLDHRADDVFWNMADPGWGYGLYQAVIGPLALGRAALLLSGGFDADRTVLTLSRHRVTNFAAAPTAYRSLRAQWPGRPPLALRCASSAGEPLDAATAEWAADALGTEIHDHYGQTELGMVAGHGWHPAIRPAARTAGSMGRSFPGWRLRVLDRTEDVEAPPGEPGRLAVDRWESPLMWFTGYGGGTAPARRWHVTGDIAVADAAGNLTFTGRADDVIIMAGYRIGPHDIENALRAHPRVADAAVVAVPDGLRGEVIEAFVVLSPDDEPGEELVGDLQTWVKRHHAAHAYPRSVRFVAELPRTPSGKVRRDVLRAVSAAAPH